MKQRHWRPDLTLVQVLVLVLVLVSVSSEASFSLHMNDFISAVKQLEDGPSGPSAPPGPPGPPESPGPPAPPRAPPLAVLRSIRRAAGLNDSLVQHFLGDAESGVTDADSAPFDYIRRCVSYRVTDDVTEEGVVLTPDGTSVALGPLLLGLEAGLLTRRGERLRAAVQLSLGRDIARSLSLPVSLPVSPPVSPRVGADGCWNSLTSPGVFTLAAPPALLTTAQVNGAMDGVVLGVGVASGSRLRPLSALLTRYYSRPLSAAGGLDSAPRLISRRRRDNFRELVAPAPLLRLVKRAAGLRRRLEGRPPMEAGPRRRWAAAAEEAVKEFVHHFLDCPPIIPRCMWGAEPYRGTPTPLSPPLPFLYIHHTHTPAQACLTFAQCAADMRSMQRFHQDDRGWDDIGYSFVAGSDGFLYEGRGWSWRGAHTLGHNSLGYGVSFIGDYSAAPPSQSAVALVRDRLTSCAVAGGRLRSDFTLQGHRQVVNTSCPGDAFYSQITGWEHFGEVKN